MKAKQTIIFFVVLFVSVFVVSCQKEVPSGHVGMIKTSSGFDDEILAPGWHSCWGTYTQLHLMEVSDKQYTIGMKVLCADSLNFSFDVGVLAAVDESKTDLIREAFENVSPVSGNDGVITADQLFKMYVEPVVDQEARKVVSKYQTTEIVANRVKIIEEIKAAIRSSLADSLVEVKRITVNNLDFPVVITQAQEDRAKRQVEIQTEKAEQEKRLLQAQNELKIAEIAYKKELLEAAMIADANKVIGASITQEYLAWWQLKVFGEAAKGPNNWGFIPYTDFSSRMSADPSRWTTANGVMDAELLKRVQEARDSVGKAEQQGK